MTSFKKTAAVALTAITLATSFAPAAEARGGRNAAAVAGILGGLALGAMVLGSSRPAYAAPVYQECYREHVGYNRWGRAIYQRVCY